MAVLGPRLCARALSSCGKRGPPLVAVRGPLTIAAPPVAEHRLQTRRLSNCGSRAQPLHGMWDPPRPGLEPASPALAGRFPATAPRGKPLTCLFLRVKTNLYVLQIYVTWKCGPLWLLQPQFKISLKLVSHCMVNSKRCRLVCST